jgi:hypothetical protein
LQQLPGVDVGARGQLAFDGVACGVGLLVPGRPALLGRGCLPDGAAFVDLRQLERFPEGFQRGAGVGLAGEGLAAQAVEPSFRTPLVTIAHFH